MVLPLFCHHSAVCLPRFFRRYAREEASGEKERSAETTANCLNACWTAAACRLDKGGGCVHIGAPRLVDAVQRMLKAERSRHMASSTREHEALQRPETACADKARSGCSVAL